MQCVLWCARCQVPDANVAQIAARPCTNLKRQGQCCKVVAQWGQKKNRTEENIHVQAAAPLHSITGLSLAVNYRSQHPAGDAGPSQPTGQCTTPSTTRPDHAPCALRTLFLRPLRCPICFLPDQPGARASLLDQRPYAPPRTGMKNKWLNLGLWANNYQPTFGVSLHAM